MELDAVQRDAVLVLVLLYLNTIGVVRTHFVQCENVQHNQRQQHNGKSNHVEREEAVQRNTRQQVVATNPRCDVFTYDRNCAK